ncbi:MAG TPA: dihydrofolate reductase family protein [Aliidongia sp.]|uniref:dihydrofolate reductase family protein n=1 Tax=Aliidongia sp. TaxID=1914230 RepID=UPI002DDD6509|nr:dihydrofolate reductase family protein [Aliidongia sp.]HEV2674474.1 dihydrofolate reductase family protein [Aliidongia sp.]
MRELILKMFMSLDGFVGTMDDDHSWMIHPDPVAKAWGVERAWNASLHVMGSRTFQSMAGYWPTATDEYAAPMNQIPKAVFSRRGPAILEAARVVQDKPDALQLCAESWAQAYVASGDLVAEVARLKAQDGKPMYAHGGASFARSLIVHGLVDQFDLVIHPVALGQGVPIFTELSHPRRLTLVSSTAFPKGSIAQIYRPA